MCRSGKILSPCATLSPNSPVRPLPLQPNFGHTPQRQHDLSRDYNPRIFSTRRIFHIKNLQSHHRRPERRLFYPLSTRVLSYLTLVARKELYDMSYQRFPRRREPYGGRNMARCDVHPIPTRAQHRVQFYGHGHIRLQHPCEPRPRDDNIH